MSSNANTEMQITNRKGDRMNVRFDLITDHIKSLSGGLKINAVEVAQQVIRRMVDGITTVELNLLAASAAADYTANHYDYATLAGRLLMYEHGRETEGFAKCYNELKHMFNEDYRRFVDAHMDDITSEIDYSRDMNFQYFGGEAMLSKYAAGNMYFDEDEKKMKKRPRERPQDAYMRVAITVAGEEYAECYDMLSRHLISHATPTMSNSGYKCQQLGSCFLCRTDDSIEGMYGGYSEKYGSYIGMFPDFAQGSKYGGGFGNSVADIRTRHSLVRGTNGTSAGIMPFLRATNEQVLHVDQSGRRKGAQAMYVPAWYGEVDAVIESRNDGGPEHLRARELFTAMWLSDLFMQRVIDDADWTLMDPNVCPGLSDVYGDEFKQLYERYESEGRGLKTVKARTLWFKIIDTAIERGTPYVLFKDHVNRKTNHQNLGTITNSNLCAGKSLDIPDIRYIRSPVRYRQLTQYRAEIVQYCAPDYVSTCNLASLVLPNMVVDGKFDFDLLRRCTHRLVKNIDRIIDINFYAIKSSKRSNLETRPMAIGVQGLHDVFFKLGLPYDCEEAAELDHQIFEVIYHAFLQQSCALAKEKGTYARYEGSPVSKGILQPDMWGVPTPDNERCNWTQLRVDIAKYGIRNSLGVGLMPTATTAHIVDSTESFEPRSSNLGVRRTDNGDFTQVNKYMVRDMEKLGLWNEETKNAIIKNKGSLKGLAILRDVKAPGSSYDMEHVYADAYEIKNKLQVTRMAARGAYVDQTASFNLHMDKPTRWVLNAVLMFAWRSGLKTGMYYLRSKAAHDAVQITVTDDAGAQKKKRISSSGISCDACVL